MAKKRGVLAEINHQMKVAAREQEKRRKAQEREQAAAARKLEQARKAEERAMAQASRAEAAELKRLEKLAKDAHIESMTAEADLLNAQLLDQREELENLLPATLDVDDFVDLASLKRDAVHPPFDRPDLNPQAFTPPPPPPPKPELLLPPEPTGVGGIFGKKQHAAKVEQLTTAHADRLQRWKQSVQEHQELRARAEAEHASAEQQRAQALQAAHAEYNDQCASREREVEAHNAAIDTLVANLGYGVAEAVEEYVSIVVANSVYPDGFKVSHDFDFMAELAELAIQVSIPAPSTMPTVKSYKYVRSSDEIRATDLSQKAKKDLYVSAAEQVSLRTLHEIFEADRRGIVQTIALQVGTAAPDPATGIESFIPLIAVSAARDTFTQFDLAAVQPRATLEHLRAAVSKDPFGLKAADTKGVRAL